MVKVKIEKNKIKIIDDAECTPGQSRQYDLFEAEVLQYLEKNPNAWLAVFNELDSAFEIDSMEYNRETDETLVRFKFKG